MTAAATAPPPPDAAPTPEETARQVITRLTAMVLYGRPRAAIAAFEGLVALDQYFRETLDRMVELSKASRPRVAARAVKALVRARLAERRYRDGQSPLRLL